MHHHVMMSKITGFQDSYFQYLSYWALIHRLNVSECNKLSFWLSCMHFIRCMFKSTRKTNTLRSHWNSCLECSALQLALLFVRLLDRPFAQPMMPPCLHTNWQGFATCPHHFLDHEWFCRLHIVYFMVFKVPIFNQALHQVIVWNFVADGNERRSFNCLNDVTHIMCISVDVHWYSRVLFGYAFACKCNCRQLAADCLLVTTPVATHCSCGMLFSLGHWSFNICERFSACSVVSWMTAHPAPLAFCTVGFIQAPSVKKIQTRISVRLRLHNIIIPVIRKISCVVCQSQEFFIVKFSSNR